MNLQGFHTSSTRQDKKDERLGRLGEHLFAQLASTTPFDAIQLGVNSAPVYFSSCEHRCDNSPTRPLRRWCNRVESTV
jgi:hypothetical protein